MVVYVVHTRRGRRRAGENVVRLASSSAAAPAFPSSAVACRSLSRGGGLPLRATSPTPPYSIRGSASSWDSRSLRSDGEEDWEEVVAAGARAAPGSRGEPTEEQGVVFGAPPTEDEVHAAVASIKQVFDNFSAVDSDGPELALALPISGHPSFGIFENHFAIESDALDVRSYEWSETAHKSSAQLLTKVTKEHKSVLDAVRLLNENTSLQKMVMALSTDKAVWQAVTNNEVVQEFKRSFEDAKETNKESSTAPRFIMWVLENTQSKIKEFFEKIIGLVNLLFQAGDKDYDISDDVVRMSFMLSVFVFIVVTIARIH